MAELIIISIHIISTLIIGFNMIVSKRYLGELRKFTLNVSDFEVIFLLIITIVGFFAVYGIYRLTKTRMMFFLKSGSYS